MVAKKLWLWAWVSAAALAAQTGSPPGEELLNRIKTRAEQNLKGLPNYTCLQTIERSQRSAPALPFEPVDRIRLEVALIDKQELFAWPGAGNFEEKDISEFVPGGSASTGSFALHAYAIFLSHGPSFSYVGEESRGGSRVIRYDYRVPRAESGYYLRRPLREAEVGYHGSFWVDARTLDLVRLEVIADDIPPDLELTEATDAVEYSRVRIGTGDFLLPSSSELSLADTGGSTSLNRTQFSGCRQFTGEAILSFGDLPPAQSGNAGSSVRQVTIPPGLNVELELESEIDTLTAAVGDAIQLRVAADVMESSTAIFRKGAAVSGRVAVLRRSSSPYPNYSFSLHLSSIDLGGARGGFTARLIALGELAGYTTYNAVWSGVPADRMNRALLLMPPSFQSAEYGAFVVTGSRVVLPKGFRMRWRTEAAQPETAK